MQSKGSKTLLFQSTSKLTCEYEFNVSVLHMQHTVLSKTAETQRKKAHFTHLHPVNEAQSFVERRYLSTSQSKVRSFLFVDSLFFVPGTRVPAQNNGSSSSSTCVCRVCSDPVSAAPRFPVKQRPAPRSHAPARVGATLPPPAPSRAWGLSRAPQTQQASPHKCHPN